ncbi:serine protease [candidate division TA06 bacterium]|uniref:Serine protease n=1 Tax=candidate division TA06 bacterium TaxID=2250710 RepID=A0A523URF7_UNCT6|nr:MAG: serine protease [candidate division TA06 bacterium]
MTGKGKSAPRAVGCFLIICIASVVSIPTVSSELTEGELTAIADLVEPATVFVQTLDWRGRLIRWGSGFIVNEYGAVVTASHVVHDPNRTVVRTIFGEIYPIDGVLAEDKERDVILLSAPVPRHALHPLPLASSPPEPGEHVVLVQHPHDGERTILEGIVEAAPKIPEKGTVLVIRLPIVGGWSGSAVINTKGEVVGVANDRIGTGPNTLTVAAPAAIVPALLSGENHSFFPWKSDASDPPNDSPEDLYWAGRLVQIYRGRREALSYFEQAFEKDPEYAEAYIEAAFCYGKLERYDDEIYALRDAIRIIPSDAGLHFRLGSTYCILERHDEAIESYLKGTRIDPDDIWARFRLGLIYERLKRYEEAAREYREYVRLAPDYGSPHASLGRAYTKLGQYDDAVEEFKKAIQIDPGYDFTYSSLAEAYYGMGLYGEGIRAHEIASRLSPEDAFCHRDLGRAYARLGEVWLAAEQYTILRNLDSSLGKIIAEYMFDE